jgi:hypothetical protein
MSIVNALNQEVNSFNTLTGISLKPQINFEQMPTVNGEPLDGGGISSIQFKKLTSLSTRNNNTYTKESDLSNFSIDAGSTYKVEIQLIASSTSADGIKCRITTPSTISTSVFNVGNAVDFSNAFKSLSYSNDSNTEIILFASAISIPQFRAFTGFFIFTANQSGVLDFEWAKQNNTAGQTTSLSINSCITVTKLST